MPLTQYEQRQLDQIEEALKAGKDTLPASFWLMRTEARLSASERIWGRVTWSGVVLTLLLVAVGAIVSVFHGSIEDFFSSTFHSIFGIFTNPTGHP